MEKSKMLTKIALAAALVIGTAGAALASENNGGNETGGYRELGPGGAVTDGVNPAFHRSLRAGASIAYGYAPGFAPEQTKHR
jgi:hypothetical protein